MSSIDEAYRRFTVLSRLIQAEHLRARANPQSDRNVDLGVTDIGDTKSQALTKIDETFEVLARLVEHGAILDMSASLEQLFRQRAANAIGEMRKTVSEHQGSGKSGLYGPSLVKDVEDFEGLKDILVLMETSLSKSVVSTTKLVRESRNRFAHGTNLRIPPIIEPAVARENLEEIARKF